MFKASPVSVKSPTGGSYPPLNSLKLPIEHQFTPSIRANNAQKDLITRQNVLPSIHLTGNSVQSSIESDVLSGNKKEKNSIK